MTKQKETSPTRKLAAKVLYATFTILKEAGGSLRGAAVIEKIKDTVEFDEWEQHRYEKTGYIRWKSILHFFSIDCTKAGYLHKSKGIWILTPEGEQAMSQGPYGLLDSSNVAYKLWVSKQQEDDTLIEVNEIKENVELNIEQQQIALLSDYEDIASEGLRNFVLDKNPYEFQDLVATLLTAMGYFIAHISPRGKDGGIDIIAYNDPLGTKPPRMVIQVKHRPNSTIPADDIRRLAGTMKRESDVGIFVTSGDFSSPAKNEARTQGKHIELIDFNRFINLWTEYYNKMDDKQKKLLPLRPIYFLEIND
jgi:restriction system protein